MTPTPGCGPATAAPPPVFGRSPSRPSRSTGTTTAPCRSYPRRPGPLDPVELIVAFTRQASLAVARRAPGAPKHPSSLLCGEGAPVSDRSAATGRRGDRPDRGGVTGSMPSGEAAVGAQPDTHPGPARRTRHRRAPNKGPSRPPGPGDLDGAAVASPALDMLGAALASCDPPRHPQRSGARAVGPAPGWSVEVVLLGGEEGRRLDALQAAAIKEVLGWLHTQRQRQATNPTPSDG
jgi:hypothetical protein